MIRHAALLALAVLAACARGSLAEVDGAPIDMSRPIDAAIDGNNCSVQPCSILPQCGCGSADACDVDLSDRNGTACRNILTPGTETSSCVRNTGCDRGFVCIGGNAYASCKKYCTADADCGSPRGQCVLQQTNGGVPIPDVPRMCTSNCEPTDTTAAGCPSTFKCTLYTATIDSMTKKVADCSLAGTKVQGEDCTSGNAAAEAMCAKGHQCVKLTTEATYKCRRICTNPMAGSTQCGGQECIGFSEAHTIAGTTYGVCGP